MAKISIPSTLGWEKYKLRNERMGKDNWQTSDKRLRDTYRDIETEREKEQDREREQEREREKKRKRVR